jgi:hypothetical protein
MDMATKNPGATPQRKAVWLFLIVFLILLAQAAACGQGERRQPSQSQVTNADRGRADQRAASRGVRQGDLDKWMYSRVVWVAIAGGIAGFLLSWFYLTRLPYEGRLEIERQARSIFFVTLVFIVLPGVLLALYADMYLYAFSGHFAYTLLGALFGTQGLLLAVAAILLFTIVSVGVTRFKSGSRCPYMLWPRPKVG